VNGALGVAVVGENGVAGNKFPAAGKDEGVPGGGRKVVTPPRRSLLLPGAAGRPGAVLEAVELKVVSMRKLSLLTAASASCQ
jgi:hypothetical protein